MLFTSALFVLFHLLVVALRWSLSARWVGPLLLVSSTLFYASWGPGYALLMAAVILLAWLAGLGLERHRASNGKWWIAGAVTLFLGVLGYFKYTRLLMEQWTWILGQLGQPSQLRAWDLALPLAISFYTFEAISYVVDVYRGAKAERSLPRLALYIAYYPHLVAGPIVRPNELLPQLRTLPAFEPVMFLDGVFLMLLGFVKKLVFADRLAVWSDAVFADPAKMSTWDTWVGVLAYTGQIYCDFSGYTDIARGASMTLGLKLPDNFNLPYLSTSITEFWRRWHMTLSRWLKDYLYIPLGGNRSGPKRQAFNLFLTMLLGGLWHGANWTFVFWGALHGTALIVHKQWRHWSDAQSWKWVRDTKPYAVLAWAVTLVSVMVGWVFFRAPTFQRAFLVLGRMFTPAKGLGEIGLEETLAILGALAVFHVLARGDWWERRSLTWGPVPRAALWAGMTWACYFLAQPREQFIYFQF
jgi:alginate O-acetyltransferase complex protein AlgI